MNLWHDISYGENAPNEIVSIIEIPAHSRMKYEIDKETGLLLLDRALYSAVAYPGNYGFIPQTYCDDKDPLDIILIGDEELYPLTKCTCRPIGVVRMIDGGEQDDKIIGVLVDDPQFEGVNDLEDVHEHLIKKIRHFFETYKLLQNKPVEITAVEGAQAAKETIQDAIALYEKEFQQQA